MGYDPPMPPRKSRKSACSAAFLSEPICTIDRFLQIPAPAKEPLIDGLLYRRDLVILAGRRRNGKTALLLNLALPLASGNSFLSFSVLGPIRPICFLLEDDTRELQEKLKPMLIAKPLDSLAQSRLAIYTQDYFTQSEIPIGIHSEPFRERLAALTALHRPDLVILDNAAALISGDINNPKIVHQLARFCFRLSQSANSALLLAAHPRKMGDEKVNLRSNPEEFFEEVMGHSHLINSFGSLWGLQRNRDDLAYFPSRGSAFSGNPIHANPSAGRG